MNNYTTYFLLISDNTAHVNFENNKPIPDMEDTGLLISAFRDHMHLLQQ